MPIAFKGTVETRAVVQIAVPTVIVVSAADGFAGGFDVSLRIAPLSILGSAERLSIVNTQLRDLGVTLLSVQRVESEGE